MRKKARLLVNLRVLSENLSKLKSLSQQEPIFMVKANAYGHGSIEVVDYCYNELKITNFGVATLFEALELREALPGKSFSIYVFSENGIDDPNLFELACSLNLHLVIHSLEQLEVFLKRKCHLPLCLKFNTGMNRLGIQYDQVEHVIKLLKSYGCHSVEHLMTHFHSSSKKIDGHDLTTQQYGVFNKIKKELQINHIAVVMSSVANSGAIEQSFAPNESHIRPGLMLYGPQSFQWGGKIISHLQADLLSSLPIKKGEIVGYGATSVKEDGHLYHFPLGYADGLLHYYHKAKFQLDNTTSASVIGKINMDVLTLFVAKRDQETQLKQPQLSVWDHDKKKFEDLVQSLRISPYQLFTAISPRVPRIYSR